MNRNLFTAVAFLVLVFLVASCAPAQPETIIQTVEVEKEVPVVETVEVTQVVEKIVTEEVQAPTEKSSVEVWFYPGDQWGCAIDGPIADFNVQSDAIHVEGVRKSQDLRDQVQLAIAGGAGPDILTPFGPAHIAELVEADRLLALDSYAQQYKWDETIVPWALDLGRVDGILYSLPVELETLVLWYNKGMFEEHGWEPPTTMAELTALAEEIEAAGIIPFAGGIGDCPNCISWYFGEFVNHVAGPEKVYQALSGAISWADPALVDSIETWNDMMQRGWWMGGVDRFFVATFDEFTAAFGSGEAAMNMEGTWFPGRVGADFESEAGMEYDWVPFPSETGEAIYSLGIGGTRSINRTASDPQAAAEWLTYEFSPEVQARLFVDCGIALAPVKVDASMLEGVDPRLAAIYADFSKAQAEGRYGYTEWTFWTPGSSVYITEELQKVLTGDLTAEAFLEGLDQAYKEDVEAGLGMPLPER